MVFGKQSLQGTESHRRYADGVRVQNIPRIHEVGPPREDLRSDERPAEWTCAGQRQDHLHVNVQRHCMVRKRKHRKMWIQFTDSCGLCSQIPSRSLVFLGPGSEEKRCGTCTNRPDGSWNQSAENTMANFSGSGHPIFRASSAFERGELRSKGGGKKSIHFNGGEENIELLLCTVISANQLMYPKISGLGWNLQHKIIWKRWKFLPTSLLPMHRNGETYGNNMSDNANNCQKTIIYPNCVLMRVWSWLNENNTSILLKQKKDHRCNIYVENIRCLAMTKGLV